MGCDYYTYTYLDGRFTNGNILYIEVNRIRGYWHFNYPRDENDDDSCDSEDYPDFNEKFDEYINDILEQNFPTVKIYENGEFVNPLCCQKYKRIIADELTKNSKTLADVVYINEMTCNERRWG
jgi:hypothetical protein